MHGIRFWKGQCFSNEARTGLSQGAIPTFHVVGLSAAFPNALVCLCRKNQLIGFPKVAITLAAFVGLRNLFPKFAAGGLTPIPNDKRHKLACATAHDRPNPTFVPLFVDKRPHFICFQHIFGFGRQERVFKVWVGCVFFLTKTPALDDWHQRCVARRAYWNVHDTQTKSALSGLRCIHVSVPRHRACRSPYTHIAGCHSHCVHFWQYFDYCTFDIYKQLVWLSCSHYTTNHFNLSTTQYFIVPKM